MTCVLNSFSSLLSSCFDFFNFLHVDLTSYLLSTPPPQPIRNPLLCKKKIKKSKNQKINGPTAGFACGNSRKKKGRGLSGRCSRSGGRSLRPRGRRRGRRVGSFGFGVDAGLAGADVGVVKGSLFLGGLGRS